MKTNGSSSANVGIQSIYHSRLGNYIQHLKTGFHLQADTFSEELALACKSKIDVKPQKTFRLQINLDWSPEMLIVKQSLANVVK
jgi:hypothetical protein